MSVLITTAFLGIVQRSDIHDTSTTETPSNQALTPEKARALVESGELVGLEKSAIITKLGEPTLTSGETMIYNLGSERSLLAGAEEIALNIVFADEVVSDIHLSDL